MTQSSKVFVQDFVCKSQKPTFLIKQIISSLPNQTNILREEAINILNNQPSRDKNARNWLIDFFNIIKSNSQLYTGHCVRYNSKKKYGFISLEQAPYNHGDIFFHKNQIRQPFSVGSELSKFLLTNYYSISKNFLSNEYRKVYENEISKKPALAKSNLKYSYLDSRSMFEKAETLVPGLPVAAVIDTCSCTNEVLWICPIIDQSMIELLQEFAKKITKKEKN